MSSSGRLVGKVHPGISKRWRHQYLVKDSNDKLWIIDTQTSHKKQLVKASVGQSRVIFRAPGRVKNNTWQNSQNMASRPQEPLEEAGSDYQEAMVSLEDDKSGLAGMEYSHFVDLHDKTEKHWRQQHQENRDDLTQILRSNDDVLVHKHSNQRKGTKGLPELYKRRTIELCVITDPYVFELIKDVFNLKTDKEINLKIFKTVHKILLSAETFLKHSSISQTGQGFHLKLNGIRVLKKWGHLEKMKSRKNLQDILFDLGDYMQVKL